MDMIVNYKKNEPFAISPSLYFQTKIKYGNRIVFYLIETSDHPNKNSGI
jgi:hypothetical protein